MTPGDAIARLQAHFGADVVILPEFRGEHGVRVPRERVREVCRFLKDECACAMLTDLTGVDNLGTTPRFELSYLLYSLRDNFRLRVKTAVPEEDATVDSVTGVWRTADWHERETYDMLGIRFRGHPDLRRILMWDDYPHFPLRKDFPLAGIPADLPATAVNAGSAETAPDEGGQFITPVGMPRATRREPRSVDTLAERDARAVAPDRQEEV